MSEITIDKRVAQFVKLRDMIKAEEKEFAEKQAPKKEMLQKLGDLLLAHLISTGADHIGTEFGTAMRNERVSATIADGDAFRRHVIGTEAWDLIDWRANATAVKGFVEENQAPPPGINYSKQFVIGVRRK